LAGAFENLEGLIIGGFTSIEESDSPFGKNYQQMILEITKGKKYPILFEFPAGHIKDNRALILGREVELKVSEDKGTLKF
jgi:muramoyltetrapeptide carboxypeptidase